MRHQTGQCPGAEPLVPDGLGDGEGLGEEFRRQVRRERNEGFSFLVWFPRFRQVQRLLPTEKAMPNSLGEKGGRDVHPDASDRAQTQHATVLAAQTNAGCLQSARISRRLVPEPFPNDPHVAGEALKPALVDLPCSTPAVLDEFQKPIRFGVELFQVLRIELEEIRGRLPRLQLTCIQASGGVAARAGSST